LWNIIVFIHFYNILYFIIVLNKYLEKNFHQIQDFLFKNVLYYIEIKIKFMMEKLIIVIYVGIQGLRSEDIENFINKLSKRIIPTSIEGEFIMIPTQSLDTRIECINPKYITESDLIEKHTTLMQKLQEELQYQLNFLKLENNEQN
jgi:hypothetical protein